jgi:hypothetical protein
MPEGPDKNEKLARILWEVHAHILPPFYRPRRTRRRPEDEWEALPEKAMDETEVDKRFFRKIAAHALRRLTS